MKRLAIICTTLGVLAMSASAAVPTLTENWRINAGDRPWMQNDANVRGCAYNPATDHVLVVSRTGALSIQVLEASTGAPASPATMNVTGVSGGTFALSEITVDDTGVVYASNLVTSAGNAYRIYRWANEGAAPTVAVGASESVAARVGDALAVRGIGTGTILYAGGSFNPAIEVFTTLDGLTFTSGTDINVGLGPAANGRARIGIAPRTDNTNIFIGSPGNPKAEINSAGVDVATIDFDASEGLDSSVGDLAFAELNGVDLLAAATGNGVNSTGGRGGRVLRVTASSASPFITGDTPTATWTNPNGNGTGGAAIDTARGRAIILISQNGIGSFGQSLPVELTSFDTE